MRIGKAQPAPGQRINIGRINLATLAAIAVHIANAQIVGENKDNVWPFGGRQKDARRKEDNEAEKGLLHGWGLWRVGDKWLGGEVISQSLARH